ncbi:response regulator receiver protein [Desulfovibrio sp. X2]|uniref:response regulator transcription factor n=1 Tax=Desulfovibrio sp. X2 TaxID=941449 RepID=UPI000358B4C8|nr:response regulator [Desulfovibrio sp. X2]EPR43998.1 response regulator receiver protein [Desulfovibrio sp. X2]
MARVLVIDDDAVMRDMMRLYLEQGGFEVVEAGDGMDGVRRYRQRPPDVVIVDIFMPRKDGIETIIDLRGLDPAAHILAISGGGEIGGMEYLSYAKVLGADRVLCKPFRREELISAVRETAAEHGAA